MKKSLTFSNKILLILCLVVSMFFVNTFALLSNLTAKAASSNFSSYYGTNTIEVENGDFTENEKVSDGLPYNPKTGWTGISTLPSTTVSSGIIDTNFDTFNSTKNNKFGLEVNPGIDTDLTNADEEILMIKAKSGETKYGYVSDTIELKKAQFYVIEVHCKTGLLTDETDPESLINNATASIYTTLSSSSAENFLNINTYGKWKTYNIYVATDTFNSSKFEIELRLGNNTIDSDGVVFFDQVAVKEIANVDFNSVSKDQQNIVINLDNDYTNSFANNGFEEDITSTWVLDENNNTDISEIGTYSKTAINQFITTNFDLTNKNTDYANNFVHNNGKLLLMLNKEDSASKVSSHEENTITIKQHGLYLLSMLVKTGNLSGTGLEVTLTEVVEDGETAITTTQSGIICASTDVLPEYNGYQKVDFYIRGNAYFDKQVGITFELGKADKKFSGWAIIDDITLQQINQTEYSSKTTSNEFDLSKNISDTSTIKNGSFNFITNSNSTVSYPATPLNWTASENNTLSGVIRVADEYFVQDIANFGGLELSQNPGINTSYPQFGGIPASKLFQYENVLMVRNNSTEDVDYTSDEFTISSNSSSNETYTKFQVGIKTVNNAKAYIKLINKDNQVLAVYDNISSSENWSTYTIYLKNGITSQEVKLVLGTHGDGNNNYAFFDYVDYESDTKDTVANTSNSKYVNLLEDSFYSHSNTLVKPNIYKASNYSMNAYEENKSSAVYNGIIDTSNDSSLKTRSDANDTNVLVVTNTVASYQNLVSNYTYKLTQNSHYEFSVWVKTDFTNCENLEKFGAYFEIVTLDKDGNIVVNEEKENTNKFKNIVVTDEENNGWVKYSIYVIAEEADQNVKVILGLGYAENPTKGTVYFDDLKVVDVEKSEYASKVANDTTIVSKVITAETNEDSTEDSSSSSEATASSDINIWALLSSIILVVALVLAIAGYIIRRIPKKKLINKIKNSEYNKSPKSVDEKEIKRELKVAREQNLAEINAKLDELKATREKLQTEYEEASNKEESQTEKEKLYTSHTKKINKLNKEIDYLSSAITFVTDETNIKISEEKEIKKRKKEVEQEYMRIKAEELAKEEAEPVEEPVIKNSKRKGKK